MPQQEVSSATRTEVKDVLIETLGLEDVRDEITGSTELLGSLPALDSMSVVMLLTALSERFGFDIDDAEITGEAFETLDSLTAFVEDLGWRFGGTLNIRVNGASSAVDFLARCGYSPCAG